MAYHFEKLDERELSELGKKGGSKKNPKKGFGSLSKEERIESAKRGAEARWNKSKRKELDDEKRAKIRKDALAEDD